ncbi:hypothetical protein SDRG_10413 [Saprolegnia diclina VS20]|uniref:Uncharacterized protein n=1 Tax=Saprolegnia diclina (strain VS20) TaxID=1156394 RepID=T0QEA7_SAPDV|nr:hypothetical protein SDRG_10413 [Saprolegnia diclina VS20]EQC31895.1 hypothetical protein SDRG_10413 [Saprolegnia diclina VS20]|eukprot:XP_008614623.1 hypothetical protein SDRG_10413 [Saprolegnia diclina VS20]
MIESAILCECDSERNKTEKNLAFNMTLAHFAVDVIGDSSALTSTTERPHGTFATVVYFFPSTCVGGAVTISEACGPFGDLSERGPTTFESLDGCFLLFYSSCDVTVAPITSGHRSCAVYYATLDDNYFDNWTAPEVWFAPPLLPTIQELQDATRGFDPRQRNAVMIRLETYTATPTFDSLTGPDKAVVDLLLAANVYDIALVRTGEGDDKNKAIPPLSGTSHSMCKTPALVQEVYDQTPINEVAEDTDEIKSRGNFLLVWPKACRVRILGYDRTIALLRGNVDGDVVDGLGFESLHGIFEAAFRAFYPQRPHHGRNPPQVTYAMASLLYDYGDLQLIEAFMDAHERWADDENMATWLLAVLRRFGTPRFQHRLHTVKASSAFAAHLVHLATGGDALAQMIAHDCVPLWWPRLLRYIPTKRMLGDMLAVETYRSAWLRQRTCAVAYRTLSCARWRRTFRRRSRHYWTLSEPTTASSLFFQPPCGPGETRWASSASQPALRPPSSICAWTLSA